MWGGDIKWLRPLCSHEYYNIAGLSSTFRDWHATFTPSEDTLIQGVNQGFPTAVTFAIDTVLGNILQRHADDMPMGMPMGANAPNTYVTGKLWAPELSGTQPRGGRPERVEPESRRLWGRVVPPIGVEAPVPELQDESDDEDMDAPPPRRCMEVRPTAVTRRGRKPNVTTTANPAWLTDEQCMARLRESGRDWSAPLHPGKHARHREALEHALSQDEQAQAHYIGILQAQLELEETTKVSYADGLKKFMVMLNRGYPLSALSPDHERLAVTGLFEPAVWKAHEVEKVLIDTVLHEVGVRGNPWSTVRVQMYGIRHHNVLSQGNTKPLGKQTEIRSVNEGTDEIQGAKGRQSTSHKSHAVRTLQGTRLGDRHGRPDTVCSSTDSIPFYAQICGVQRQAEGGQV